MSYETLILDPSAEFLRDLAGADRGYSQFGEEPLIAATLNRIGTRNEWCFEAGAADGRFYSNTLKLREQGWNAVLIESEWDMYADLRGYASDTVKTINRRVTPENLDGILSECGAPMDMDLGIIDVDGADYWIWDGLRKYRPRIMCVEFRDPKAIPDDQRRTLVEIPPRGEESVATQATFGAIVQLANAKGYLPIAATYVNLIAVEGGAWERN